jgi:hypothetical protein
MKPFIALLLSFLLLFSLNASAQDIDEDSLLTVQKKLRIKDSIADLKAKKKLLRPMNEPLRAALLSATLPGLGQYYNRSYWYIKVPIIYGTAGILGWVIKQNHQNYVLFRDTYLYVSDNNPLTEPNPRYANFTRDNLRNNRDRFRRDRDFNIILCVVLYGLNMAEAAATAHLKNFDVSQDLSLQVSPILIQVAQSPITPALSLKFRWKTKEQKLFSR